MNEAFCPARTWFNPETGESIKSVLLPEDMPPIHGNAVKGGRTVKELNVPVLTDLYCEIEFCGRGS